MPKFFEYDDPEMAAHVNDMVKCAELAEENPTIVKSDKTIYANNNLEKPFAPMTGEDLKHRWALAQGGGRDKFVVAKHREEQEKSIRKYESMAVDRDIAGNFHISTGQAVKVAQTVLDVKVKEQKNMSYFDRIKAALSLSKEAKEKRTKIKFLKKVVESQEF